jgi:hypothetical protein
MDLIAQAINAVKELFTNPKVRLGVRAAAAAGGAFYLKIKGVDSVDAQIAQTALVAAVWAAFEVLTPANAIVGLFKQ